MSPVQSPRCFEFVGLPAAGKSTISRHMERLADAQSEVRVMPMSQIGASMDGPRGTRAVRRLQRALSLWVRTPSLLPRLLRLAPDLRFFQRNRLKRMLTLSDSAFRVERMLPAGDVVVDQGLIQGISSLCLFAPVQASRMEAAACWMAGRWLSGIIWLDADAELSRQRLGTREAGASRFDGGSVEGERFEHLAAMYRGLRAMVDAVERNGLPVLRLNALDAPEQNAARVLRWLSQGR